MLLVMPFYHHVILIILHACLVMIMAMSHCWNVGVVMMCNIVCLQIVSRKTLQQETFPFPSNLLSLPLCTEMLDRVILSLLHHHALSPHPQCQCHHLHHFSSSLTFSLASPLHTPTSLVYASAKGSLIFTRQMGRRIWFEVGDGILAPCKSHQVHSV